MLTIKLMKFNRPDAGVPAFTEGYAIREAHSVHVTYKDGGRTLLQMNDAPGETIEIEIGEGLGCSYDVAYVMNASGKTVDTIR